MSGPHVAHPPLRLPVVRDLVAYSLEGKEGGCPLQRGGTLLETVTRKQGQEDCRAPSPMGDLPVSQLPCTVHTWGPPSCTSPWLWAHRTFQACALCTQVL